MGNSNIKSEPCEECFRRNIISNKWGRNDKEDKEELIEERDYYYIEHTKLKVENDKLKKEKEEYKSRLNYVSNILEK